MKADLQSTVHVIFRVQIKPKCPCPHLDISCLFYVTVKLYLDTRYCTINWYKGVCIVIPQQDKRCVTLHHTC